MRKVEKYDNKKTYIFPSGGIATPEVIAEKYPAVNIIDYVFVTDSAGEVVYQIQSLGSMKDIYNIETDDEEEAIKLIEDALNKVEEECASPEERIAAAMEFQNLMSL